MTPTDAASNSPYTYTLVAGAGDTNNALFQIAGDKLQTAASLNFEGQSSYSVRIRVTDNINDTYEEAFTISVTDENDAPTAIQLSNTFQSENAAVGSAIGTFTASDPDGAVPPSPESNLAQAGSAGPFTYALVAGTGDTDNASFSIAGDQLANAVALDFETKSTYSIRVRVTDAGGASFESAFEIFIFNVNEPPTDILLTPSTIVENSAAGTQVGVLTTVDADGNFVKSAPQGQYTYELVAGAGDTDNAAVQLSGDVITLTGVADFETKPTYSIRVKTTESFNFTTLVASRAQEPLSFEKAITISVTNVNEPFTAESLSAAPNPATTGQVVTFTVVGFDPENALQFSYDYGDGQSGTASTHTYSVPGVFTVVVTVSDGTETTKTLSTVVTVVAAATPPADLNGDGVVTQMDDDADKDGFPDNLETGFGSEPNGSGSTPSGAAAKAFKRFRILRVNVKTGEPDRVSVNGILNVPAGFTLAGSKIVFDVGGNTVAFTLDDRGFGTSESGSVRLAARSNSRLSKEARFALKIEGDLVEKITANAAKDSNGKPTSISVNVLFNGALLTNSKGLKKLK